MGCVLVGSSCTLGPYILLSNLSSHVLYVLIEILDFETKFNSH
jgi:hypothetical protein